MNVEKLRVRYCTLQAELSWLSGRGTARRQMDEYRSDHWSELSGMCSELLEDVQWQLKDKKAVRNHSESIHGEAFAAGISGRCADCEQDKELEAENDKLKEILRQLRAWADAYPVTANVSEKSCASCIRCRSEYY